jgi:UDP-3-O-[3-hydroxymyristoyl] N-acetylglucosamine deacetylase / 3-hydroxyacyl-[acyl-carrier-protein] dehydratase
MTSMPRRTLRAPVTCSGIGVHSGSPSTLTLKPAPGGTGILFRRVDLPGSPEIPATLDHVADTELGTTIAAGEDARVLTVEHLMAALWAAEVTDVVLELDGPEPPILDGSFLPYLRAIQEAGLETVEGEIPVLQVARPISAEGGQGSRYLAAPGKGFRISASIEFDHPAIGTRYGDFRLTPRSFEEEIAPARTFGFHREAEHLRNRGLALGASLENTIVLDDSGVMNDSLRFPDEFLRHKVGDMVGDLALLGVRLEGHIVADRPSHRGNTELARAIEEDRRRNPGGAPIVDIQKILQYLPHRFPMLLVDRVIDFEAGKRIVGIKNVTINEPFFQGHYPGHPIMPGVLIIEAMAQAGGLLLMDTIENPEEKVVYFMSLDNVKWRRPVTPGDQLVFELNLLQFRRGICRMRGEAFVDGKLVAEAELMARVMDR